MTMKLSVNADAANCKLAELDHTFHKLQKVHIFEKTIQVPGMVMVSYHIHTCMYVEIFTRTNFCDYGKKSRK